MSLNQLDKSEIAISVEMGHNKCWWSDCTIQIQSTQGPVSEEGHLRPTAHQQFQYRQWIYVLPGMLFPHQQAPEIHLRPTEKLSSIQIGQDWIGLQLG
jgi:hypothetical protein